MNSPSHEQISQRAYQLWLDAGQPDGRHAEHWHLAEASLKAAPSPANPSPATHAHSSGATTLSAANNDHANQSAKPNLKSVAAAESVDENLMSPAPSEDTAISAALPADTTHSRPAPSAPPQSVPAAPHKTLSKSAPGKPTAPLVAGR